MGIKSGEQYTARINEYRPEVWLQGEKITSNLSEHMAFKGLIKTQSEMYDKQGQEPFKKLMTYDSPDTGEPVGLSFLPPRTKKELTKRRVMMNLWSDYHHGFLGRSPDYMNTALMAFSASSGLFAKEYPEYADNINRYYAYCRDNDITLSHAFIQPPIVRLSSFLKSLSLDIPSAAEVVEKTSEGIVVNGAFMLTTQGATAEEILVYPVPMPHLSDTDNPTALVFAVPNNLPGMKFICRENWVSDTSHYDHPLSSKFDEMDMLVIFDHVLVPHERVFLLGDHFMINSWMDQSQFHTHASHQILSRIIAKTEFIFGTLDYMVNSFGLSTYSHIVEKASEVIAIIESLKALMVAAEAGAKKNRFGLMLPNPDVLYSANFLYPRIYPRLVEILQLIGAGSLIMIPGENDFSSLNQIYLDQYLKAEDLDAKRKVALLRLAWEISGSSFGGRQTVYERFFFGDSTRVASRLYYKYSCRDHYVEQVKAFLDKG